jgi:cell division protein FtsZ
LADDVLRHGVQGISDLVTMTGLINLDFADVKAVMQNAGTALMAVGEGHGEGRAMMAARAAISSPLLDVSIEGAQGVLINISGGPDLTLAEVTEAAETIQSAVDPEASIYFGAVIHPRSQDDVRVTVIATGLKEGSRPTAPSRRLPHYESPHEPRAPEPPPSLSRERVGPPREREPEWTPERPRRPTATEWEREARQRPDRAEGDDDYDIPAYLRRPRR